MRGEEHHYLIGTITDEAIAEHRANFKAAFPDQSYEMDNKSDDEVRNGLARVAWLTNLIKK